MLQKLSFERDSEAAEHGQELRPESYAEEAGQGYLLQPAFYWQLIKRRGLYFVIPFIVVLTVGLALAVLLPATYLSVGKILVQSQQIPTELVRPTVTSAAQERIQVIEQRTMTRENLLAILDKFQLFPEKRAFLSASELVELMKKSAKIEPLAEPLAFNQIRSRGDNPTIVFTVGFEYSDPQAASRVANELVTRILNEDLRDRTSRATDTTKFLSREVQKLQSDSAAIDAKIALAKRSQAKSGSSAPDQSTTQLAQLKMELAQKSALYSDRHPMMQALRRQIEALEKVVVAPVQNGPDAVVPLEELQTQQENIQKNLEAASAKLAAARLGETLEKDQQSEKLEVIEQPTAPQEPIRPNRHKIAGMALLLALAAGGGLVFLLELADKSIRRSSDIFGIVDSRLVIAIPFIATHAELHQQRRRTKLWIGVAVALVLVAIVATYLFMPPLDLMIAKARVGLFK
jgi:uncharacterized protein involved in exopolysaccharide biosynthesis